METHLKHLDLFGGVGMFTLAARWAGIETVAFSEIDAYANEVTKLRFPKIKNLGDVRNLCRRAGDCEETDDCVWCNLCDAEFGDCACVGTDEFTDNYGFPSIISAGVPCQGASVDGKGLGLADPRTGLWRESLRIAVELNPTFLLLENVPGLRTRGADTILQQLEEANYAAEPFVVGSNAVGGEQRRKRVWIVAYDKAQRIQGLRAGGEQESRSLVSAPLPLRRGDGQWQVEPDLRRAPDGDARWMDRLACIGNTVTPQIPVMFFDWMRECLRAKRYEQ